MLPHAVRNQHLTPHLVYARWADRGHHRQVDHARSSHHLLDDCTGNHWLHHWRRCYSYVRASARPALSSRWSYFLHSGCDPGALCLLQTQDSISAHVEPARKRVMRKRAERFLPATNPMSRLPSRILTWALRLGAPWNSMSLLENLEDLLDQRDARENCLRCGG